MAAARGAVNMVMARYDDHAIVPPGPAFAGGHIPTALDEYLFELQGFLIIEGLLGAEQVAEPRDGWNGALAIDEAVFSIRGPGEAIPIHVGGQEVASRTGYRYHNGRFLRGEINVLTAFTDIGPGDGATMVIPGSHKSNMIHPAFLLRNRVAEWSPGGGGSVEGVAGAVEANLRAGDAILFVDALCHGSARRTAVFRYGTG